MKKTIQPKLKLRTETIRELKADVLPEVGGGSFFYRPGSSTMLYTCNCPVTGV